MKRRVLIIGAGEAGSMVVREIAAHTESGLEPVGFLDDNPALSGGRREGLPVLGPCADLLTVIKKNPVDEVIISVPSAGREFIRRMVGLCRDAGLPFKIVPGLIEIIKGPVHLEQIRDVHPEDLLGRETVEFDEASIQKELAGKTVLITGAGGSIGGEIARQIGRFDLESLFLLGRGENQIYDIEYELRSLYPSRNIEVIICDIRDLAVLRRTFKKIKPQFIYHAAAHKHVHYMEAFPEEAVKNNVFGTANIIESSRESRVERLVMLSTDKAVRPSGVMGATKRLAEYLMARNVGNDEGLRLMSVRFGNVLGSRGSVVPLFIKQIRNGEVVTVSHPEASRFFMTLKEACMLVIQASLLGKGGEIFILRMGSPIKIVEMAKDLIAMHGLRPDIDVKIEFSGLRPGEKLHEDLITEDEQVQSSPNENILVSHSDVSGDVDLDGILEQLRDMAERGERDKIRKLLNRVIPDAQLEE